MKKDLVLWLLDLGASRELLAYARTCDSWQACWDGCKRADWLMWIAERTKPNGSKESAGTVAYTISLAASYAARIWFAKAEADLHASYLKGLVSGAVPVADSGSYANYVDGRTKELVEGMIRERFSLLEDGCDLVRSQVTCPEQPDE